MDFFTHMKDVNSPERFYLTQSAVIWGTLAWFISFVFQFYALNSVNLDPSFVAITTAGIPVGASGAGCFPRDAGA